MDNPETSGVPVDVAAAPVIAVEPALDSGAASQIELPDADDIPQPDDAPPSPSATPVDAEAAAQAAKDAEKSDREKQLRTGMSRASNATLNRKTRETVDHLATLDVAGKKEYLEKNPHAKILSEIDYLRNLSAERLLKEGPVALDKSDPPYVFNGKTLGSITAVDGSNFTCTISGSTETIPLTRDQLVAIAIGTNITDVIANFPDGSPQRKLIQTYFDTSAPGTELTKEQIDNLPDLITEVASANGQFTTGDLVKTLETHIVPIEIPADASAEDQARLTEQNAQRALQLETARTELQKIILPTGEDIRHTFDTVGLTSENAHKQVAAIRERIPELKKEIDAAQSGEIRDKLKAQLDTIEAQSQVYNEMLKLFNDGSIDAFVESQEEGNVPPDLGKKIVGHAIKNEIDALAYIVSPETSVKATAEQKTKARLDREKNDKILKGVGIAAALAALLLALGISQGTKA